MRANKKRLGEIRKLRRALAYCERELTALLNAPGNPVAVRAADHTERVKHKKAEYRRRAADLKSRAKRLESWIASIPDMEVEGYSFADLEELRDILTERYISGKTWKEIAAEYYAPELHNESYPRRKSEKFLSEFFT